MASQSRPSPPSLPSDIFLNPAAYFVQLFLLLTYLSSAEIIHPSPFTILISSFSRLFLCLTSPFLHTPTRDRLTSTSSIAWESKSGKIKVVSMNGWKIRLVIAFLRPNGTHCPAAFHIDNAPQAISNRHSIRGSLLFLAFMTPASPTELQTEIGRPKGSYFADPPPISLVYDLCRWSLISQRFY